MSEQVYQCHQLSSAEQVSAHNEQFPKHDASPGDWIVYEPDGVAHRLSDSEFQASFIKADDGAGYRVRTKASERPTPRPRPPEPEETQETNG